MRKHLKVKKLDELREISLASQMLQQGKSAFTNNGKFGKANVCCQVFLARVGSGGFQIETWFATAVWITVS